MKQTVPSAIPSARGEGRFDTFLTWYFVIVWGSGFLAAKTGLLYAAPFTFLSLRFAFGVICLVPWVILSRPRWPADRRQVFHICVAGLLMHAVNLGGSHYAQYLGMSAGVTALILATQPLFTAAFAHRMMGERLGVAQWTGVALGLAGVVLVVWHKVNVQAATLASLVAITIAVAGITSGTLYQRVFCKTADLRSAALIQFSSSLLLVAPFAWAVEGFAIRWSVALAASVIFVVILSSILAVNALHTLMRRGQAASVTSLLFLTPVIAVLLEWLMFDVAPTWLSAAGIAVSCAGVALVARRRAG